MASKKDITNDKLAQMVQTGFESMAEKFVLTDRYLLKIDQRFVDIDCRFESVGQQFKDLQQELHNFRLETRDDMALIKQNFKTDTTKVASMSKEDSDAYGQDIILLKKKQRELETQVKRLRAKVGIK